jgi:hypothetical protein
MPFLKDSFSLIRTWKHVSDLNSHMTAKIHSHAANDKSHKDQQNLREFSEMYSS